MRQEVAVGVSGAVAARRRAAGRRGLGAAGLERSVEDARRVVDAGRH